MSETIVAENGGLPDFLIGPPVSDRQVRWTASHNARDISPVHPGGLDEIFGRKLSRNETWAEGQLVGAPTTNVPTNQAEGVASAEPTAASYNQTLAAQFQAAAHAEARGNSDKLYYAHQAAVIALQGFGGQKNWDKERLTNAIAHLDKRFSAMIKDPKASTARTQAAFDRALTAPRAASLQPPAEITADVAASSGRRWRLGLRAGTAMVGLAVILAGATSSEANRASADRSVGNHNVSTTRAGGNQQPTIPSQSSSPVADEKLSGITTVPERTPSNQVTIRHPAVTPQHKTAVEPQASNHKTSSGYTGKHRKPGFITRRLSKGDTVDHEVSVAEPAHLTPGQHTKLVSAVVRRNHISNTRTMPVGAKVSISKWLLAKATKFKK